MPTLPDLPSLGNSSAPQPAGGIASFEPPNWRQVGMAGQEVSSAGGALEQAADTIAQTNERQDAIVAQSAANSLRQAAIGLQYDPTTGFANVKEGGTVGSQFVDDYTQKLANVQDAISGHLTSQDQQQMFRQHAEIIGLQYRQALLEHQARQTDLFNDTTADDTVKLALRSMASRPLDDLNFAGGMAQINATIDGVGQRKGLSPASVQALKGQYLDQAYSTRILTVSNGIPGVVQSNPYLAEKMFDQVQDQLGPQAQTALGAEVQNAVKSVQQRDIAQKIFNGGLPTSPALLAPITDGTAPLAGIVKSLETGSGPGTDAVSPKGAQGAMQVMPDTAANPGYGVRPAQVGADGKPLPGELERVGRDYLGAMTARYDNPALVLAAYNAGPGQVDKWIQQFGDPRIGQISTADWAAKIPFSETSKYVANGLGQLLAAHAAVQAQDAEKANPAQFAGTTGADGRLAPMQPPPSRPTVADLKTRLPGMMAEARNLWAQMYPNDPIGADAAASRVEGYWNEAIRGQQAQQQASSDTLTQAIVGQQGDGSDAPRTLEQAFADPQVKAAYDSASPETRLAFQQRLARGDKQLDASSVQTYYGLLGMAGNNPEAFVNTNLSAYYGQVPDNLLLALMNQQKSINAKDIGQQQRDLNWKRSLGDVQQMVAPVIDSKTVGEAKSKQLMDQFSGRFSEALQQYHDTNQKWPDTPTTQKIAGGLLAQGAVAGSGWLWGAGPDATERFFQAQSEGKASQFYVPLPPAKSEMRAALNQDFQRKYGRPPASDNELQAAVTKQVLASGKAPPWMPQ